jgi:hypothetical protein
MADHVGGFSIPSYQRPYRWEPQDIRRLIEDLVNGLDRIVTDANAVSFIGALITVSGVPNSHDTKPSDARQIIDGQQRLTTIAMLAMTLHNRLRRLPSSLEPGPGDDDNRVAAKTWMLEQASEATQQLASCLAENKAYGDASFKALPKLVREISDRWSTKADLARYQSPIAHLLHKYACSLVDETEFVAEMPITYTVPGAPGASLEDHQLVLRRYEQIKGYVRQVARAIERDIPATVDLTHLLSPGSPTLMALFGEEDAAMVSALRQLVDGIPAAAEPLRILLLTKFLLERVALTQINAKDENYAFDLFDSLNSTGEPLTAFETFLPLVVMRETVDKYAASESYQHMADVSQLLSSSDADIQKQTARLITAFLLSDCGLKVSNRHNDQRRELSRRYDDLAETIDQRRAMTRHLADTAVCYFKLWLEGELVRALDDAGSDDWDVAAQFCLRFMKSINHTIVVAPLSRYFATYRVGGDEGARAELIAASTAMCAFSVLWRAAHGGTDGIDGEYRRLMSSGIGGVMQPLARTKVETHDPRDVRSVGELKAALRSLLATSTNAAFTTEDEWVNFSLKRPMYREQPELARFLLLTASHHAIPDADSGLTKDGAEADHTNMITPVRWTDDRMATLEHIAPQKRGVDTAWDDSLYGDVDTIHSIGNLTLVPLETNVLLGNRPWTEKQVLYRALSAEGPDVTDQVFDDAEASGLGFPVDLRTAIRERRRHLPVLTAVANFSGVWNAEFTRERGEHLLRRAYKILNGWLE